MSFSGEYMRFEFVEIGIKVVIVNISIRQNLETILFSFGDHSYNIDDSRECLR